jgi:ATP-dependent Clp protease ATP-binding subunit ClpC
VNELNADPYCVVLLDEADKAHPDVLQPFLNLFDEGWVTDQRGAKAYGTKAIFLLTTNVGQRMIADLVREGKPIEEIAARMKEALSQIRHSKSDRPVFTPEFLARIKRVIVFKPLDATAMQAIARKQAADLVRTWAETRGKELRVPAELTEYIGAAAHQLDRKSGGKEGGRVVGKLVAEWVEAPVQREMSNRPDEYRGASAVIVEFSSPPDLVPEAPYPVPAVQVRFDATR